MMELSNEAQDRLQRYVQQMRTSLRGCRSVDPDEVERDVMEHIESELQGKREPISLGDLDVTLDKLGSPDQWVPGEELPLWRQVISKLRKGPEDYRLAYISFGLLLVGAILAIRTGVAYFLVLLAASFCLSRAGVEAAANRDELGAQRWLIYPPLVLVYLGLACSLFLWPVALNEPEIYEEALWGWYGQISTKPSSALIYHLTLCATLCATAVWWTILGIVFRVWPALPRAIFRPFADGFNSRWGRTIMFVGLGLVILSALAFSLIL